MAFPYRNAPWQVWETPCREDCTPWLTDFLGEAVVFLKPNAGAHLLPEAGATQERRLEAVRCSAWLGPVPTRLRLLCRMIPLRRLLLGALTHPSAALWYPLHTSVRFSERSSCSNEPLCRMP